MFFALESWPVKSSAGTEAWRLATKQASPQALAEGAALTARPRKRAPGKKGRERRRMILDAAKERLMTGGVGGLVLRELAEDLEITHGNLQYYFATKADLLRTIFDDEVRKYTTEMHEALQSTSSVRSRLDAVIDSSIDVLESKETHLWRVLIGIADSDPELAAILKRENDYYERELANELAAIAPELREGRRAHIAKIVRLIMDGLAIDFIYEKPRSPRMTALKSEIKVLLNALLEIE